MDNQKVCENVEQVYETIKNNRLAILTRCKEDERGEIHDVDLMGFHFANLDLSHAVFRNVNLTGVEFNSCDLSYCMFIDCKNDDRLAVSTTIFERCTGDDIYVRGCNFDNGLITHQCRFTNLEMEQTIIDGLDLKSTEIYESAIEECKFTSIGARYCVIANTAFDKCTIYGKINYGGVRSSRFAHCDMIQTIWSDMELRDISLFTSNICGAKLLGCTVIDLECIDCDYKKLHIADSNVFDIKFNSYGRE